MVVGEAESFGVDAPPALAGLVAASAAAYGAAVWLWRRVPRWPAAVAAASGTVFGLSAALYAHTTLRGKFLVWQGLLDELVLRGDERVLDLGCGRGAVLIAAAERLPAGSAIGVDLWRGVDQSGNAAEATRANAAARGVADRITMHTADMTALPLPDEHVDVVLSNLAIHNIAQPSARATAVREAVRVLAPGGRLAIVDLRHVVADYARTLREAGVTDVRTRDLGPRFWYGGPWAGARLVTATKPGAAPPTP